MSERHQWTRRQILVAGLGGTTVVAVGARLLLGGRLDYTTIELSPELAARRQAAVEEARSRLGEELAEAGITFESDAIDHFFADYQKNHHQLTWPEDLRPATRFLLSTDFFDHGADATRTVKYVAFYDPYLAPCRLPRRS